MSARDDYPLHRVMEALNAHHDPTDYEIVLMHVRPIARRTFGTPPVDADE